MTPEQDATTRHPKGDHNRRLSLGIDASHFAAEAGVTLEALLDYERTSPDHRFDAQVARRVGETLDRLEAILPNSQTGRQYAAGAAAIDNVGLVTRLPLIGAAEDLSAHPLYRPGGR